MKKSKLSVVLAVRNEEENIGRCLLSVKNIANEIIVFDESSEDKTIEIAKALGAVVYKVKHESNFHITKQKAIDTAKGDWILQLDADEVITKGLEKEIIEAINLPNEKLLHLGNHNERLTKLFNRHQKLIEERDGKIGKETGEVVAFFIPRVNIFMGKPLIHGGVYPDPAIRLIKRGKAWLPAKNVHEIMKVDGEVRWLMNAMEHYDSPTFERYIKRNNRYTDLFAKEYEKQKLPINFSNSLKYLLVLPISNFFALYLRHKAILDGYRGFIWSFFSALRFPVSYIKYLTIGKIG
jgi:glycosyltransferase involved in cell wall biosynthesis